jgi:hypothetical protein
MKITIDIDEKKIVEQMVEGAIELDKDVMKQLIRGLITEFMYALNPPTVKKIVEKFIEIESEINYTARKEV